MKRHQACLAALLVGGVLIQPVSGQDVRRFPEGNNTARSDQFTIGRNRTESRVPANFDNFYYAGRNNLYALSPYAMIPAVPVPRVAGPSIPYTEEEYGRLILSTIEVGGVQPAGSRRDSRTIVRPVDKDVPVRYETVEASIVDVGDRGTLVTETQEEVRLRGVRIPSERVTDDITRYYAREAMRVLRELIGKERVYITFEEPLRESGGTLMATIHLQDGTNLNRLILEYGYGQYAADDFLPGEAPAEMTLAEEAARGVKIGLWSRR